MEFQDFDLRHRHLRPRQGNMSSLILILLLSSVACVAHAQQFYYTNSTTEDCTSRYPENAGYLCSSTQPSCETLAYYRVRSGSFSTLSNLAIGLFNTTALAIMNASSLSTQDVSVGQGLYIPMSCSCYGDHSSYNVTYTIRPGDTFYILSNTTYEGLTTCQAVQDANPTAVVTNLQIGQQVIFPIRCACPSAQQQADGLTTLVTYPVADGDDITSVVSRFGIQTTDFLDANNISNASAPLFPATTVLLPFSSKPTHPPNGTSGSGTVSSGSSQSPPPPSQPGSSKTGIYVGVAIAAAAVVVVFVVAVACFVIRRKKQTELLPQSSLASTPLKPTPHRQMMVKSSNSNDLNEDIHEFVFAEKVVTYSIDDVKKATQDFSPATVIKGAVYRGVIKGKVVAVKRVTRNISKELEILTRVHHVNLVTLLGSCIASPEQSYLVYEYAENGSLSDWLHGANNDFSTGSHNSSVLPWTARLQIALDVVTALEYIHDHTNPSYVHKDIKSSNILLDEKFRGKVANFALARHSEDEEDFTRHIVGTQGYMAPEYLISGVVSSKVDVFAFGVVLLEILSGEEAMVRDETGKEGFLYETIGPLLDNPLNAKERLRNWMDPRLQNAYPLDCAFGVAEIARRCVAEKHSLRPNAREVGYTLSKLLDIALEWEPSHGESYQDRQLEAR